MEENEYKSTYKTLTQFRCVFEKTLTNQQCGCSSAQHFWLADREGYACKSEEAAAICNDLLSKLREKSRFSLKLPNIDQPLPHNMDMRVQVGGLQGLLELSGMAEELKNSNIRTFIEVTLAEYEELDAIPYDQVVQSIARYKGRQKRKKA